MGFVSKVQVIQRANNKRQFYFICPAPLAEAMEFEKGEEIEWIVEDKRNLVIRRAKAPDADAGRKARRERSK